MATITTQLARQIAEVIDNDPNASAQIKKYIEPVVLLQRLQIPRAAILAYLEGAQSMPAESPGIIETKPNSNLSIVGKCIKLFSRKK